MLLGIDHLVIAVPDLDAAATELRDSLGLAALGGGTHPALGTANRLVWLGDSYLELVWIVDPAVAAGSWLGGPVLGRLDRGGGVVTWAVASDSLDLDVAALQAMGSSLGGPLDGERQRPDGLVVRWRLSLPGRLGPSEPPFLIEHDPMSAEWTPADRAARRDERHPVGGPVRLEVLELPTVNVPATIQGLTRALGLRFRPSLAGHGARDANLGPQIVRLAPVRPAAGPASAVPDMPATIRLASAAGDDRAVTALGCRWSLRRSG